MNEKDIRWRQRFENFQRAYQLLETYTQTKPKNELERAGVIQLFEMAFELSWKVMKDYEEAEGYQVRSPREAIKTALQMEIIQDGHVWMDALSNRNVTTHMYDEALAEKVIALITHEYFPAIKQLQETLKKEV